VKKLRCPIDKTALEKVWPQIGAVDHFVCRNCSEVYVYNHPSENWPRTAKPLTPCEDRRHIQLAHTFAKIPARSWFKGNSPDYNRLVEPPYVNRRPPQELST
jgi:hypothetical protein